MPTSTSFDADSPWGAHAPAGWQQVVINACQSLPGSPRFFYSLNKGLRGRMKAADPRFFDVEVLDLKLRLLTRGNYCETTALFAPQYYDTEELGWLRSRLQPDSVFLDIGGNVGLYSLVAASVDPGVRVITVEPNLELVERMRFNANTNHLTLDVCETALSDYSGTGELTFSSQQSGQNRLNTPTSTPVGENTEALTHSADNAGHHTVPVTTLPELLEQREVSTIDVMKIDIEGHEHKVLAHFFGVAPENLYPRSIIIEHVHDHEGTIKLLTNDIGYRVEANAARNVLLVR